MTRRSLCLALATMATLLAGTPRLAAQAAGTDVSFRVLCFEHRDNITSAFASVDETNRVEVPFYTSDFSEPLKARFTGGKARFFVEETAPDGKKIPKVIAEGNLVNAPRQAFVLIPTDAKTGPAYRIVAFDDSVQSFPMGSTRVINLAPFAIRLNLAGTDIPPIKPGGVSVFPLVKKVDEWNMYTSRIDFEVTEGKWVAVANQSWKASDRKRDWVITRFDTASRQPAIRLYQDVPPERKQELPVVSPR